MLRKSLAPKLLSLVVFGLPIGQFGFNLLDVFSLGVANSKIIIFLFSEERSFSFGFELAHAIVSKFFGEIYDGERGLVSISSLEFALKFFDHYLLILEVVVADLKIINKLSNLFVFLFQLSFGLRDVPDLEKDFVDFLGVEGGKNFFLQCVNAHLH